MPILAIDTCLGACSVAAVNGRHTLAARSDPMLRGHAEALAPMVQDVMRAAGIAFGDLKRLAVTTGPGSFTGLRAGLAFARGLALALDLPLVGLSSLRALTAGEAGLVGAVLPAPVGAYLGVWQTADAAPALPPMLAEGADLAAALAMPGVRWFGVASAEASPADLTSRPWPDPAAMARLAFDLDPAGHPPDPLYLRAPDARLPATPT